MFYLYSEMLNYICRQNKISDKQMFLDPNKVCLAQQWNCTDY